MQNYQNFLELVEFPLLDGEQELDIQSLMKDEVVEYEEKLGFPFECFINREPNLETIKEKLEIQLKAVKKAIKEKADSEIYH